jgi:hypothetical protein
MAPRLLDFRTGAEGKYLGPSTDVEKYGNLKDGCVHVLYRPAGMFSWGEHVILNVPKDAIIGPLYSKHPQVAGVSDEGYVFLLCGTNGESDLADALQIAASQKLKELHVKLKESKIGEELALVDLLNAKDNFKEIAKKDSEIKESMEGKKQRRFGGMRPDIGD